MADTQKEKELLQPETEDGLLDRATKAAAALRLENDRQAALLERAEKLKATELLGGRAEAGKPQVPELSAEEKASNERVKKLGLTTGAAWAKRMP